MLEQSSLLQKKKTAGADFAFVLIVDFVAFDGSRGCFLVFSTISSALHFIFIWKGKNFVLIDRVRDCGFGSKVIKMSDSAQSP